MRWRPPHLRRIRSTQLRALAVLVAVLMLSLGIAGAQPTTDPNPPTAAADTTTAPTDLDGASSAPWLRQPGGVLAALGADPRGKANRRIARKQVGAEDADDFQPLYELAENEFGVSRLLIASIHRQETAFSTAKGTYRGLNFAGCCGGPMQFNVTNEPVSTWKQYRSAHELVERPESYPNQTRRHPSIYDDFDSIMAAGLLLQDLGAGGELDADDWLAAYLYYGRDLYGVSYANQVMARAVTWARDGFCAECAHDPELEAKFERKFGKAERRALLGLGPKKKGRNAKKDKGKRSGNGSKGSKIGKRPDRGGGKRDPGGGADTGSPKPDRPGSGQGEGGSRGNGKGTGDEGTDKGSGGGGKPGGKDKDPPPEDEEQPQPDQPPGDGAGCDPLEELLGC